MEATEALAPESGTAPACRALGVSRARLYRRWRPAPATPVVKHEPPPSPRALSPQERHAVMAVLHCPQFVDRAPRAVDNALLDRHRYLCSTRALYRLLEQAGEVRGRRDQLQHPPYEKPELLATGANPVWSWDITKLRGPVKWTYFYLYVVLDIYSRHVVGWMLADRENAGLARRLIRETAEKQGVRQDQLTLHSDRGSPMVSQTLGQLLTTLGLSPSFSRPPHLHRQPVL